MAFKGDLRNISLFDVFQTLNQNKQTGVLVLTRDAVTKKLHISPEGVRIFFTRSFRPLRLGEIFVRRGRITPQDVEICLLEQKKEYRPFGQLLVESGKIEQHEVDRILRYHAEDEIFEIFSWESGTFSFYDGQDAADNSTPLSEIVMDPAGLCLEAARRLDEMERLRETVESNDEFFVQVDGLELDHETAGPAARVLYDTLAQPNSVDDVRDLVGLSLYDVLKGIQQLVRGGLIRRLTVEELVATADESRDAGMHERAAQLLEKAHFQDPQDRDILERCVEAIQRLHQPRRLGRLLAQLGQVSLRDGMVDDAVEHLEQALRHDPGHLDALGALREAFSQQGDVERAAETSLKIARAHTENGNIDGAIEACRAGLEVAPHALALRYFLGQLLLRADRADEARHEICGLVRDTEASKKRRSDKVHELLVNCYRLLLKIDPNDEEALLGIRNLDKRRSSSQRRRVVIVRSTLAAALVLVVGGIGITMRGPTAAEMLERVEDAEASRDTELMLQLVGDLLANHPESEEASRARALRREHHSQSRALAAERNKREERLRRDMLADLQEVRAALSDRPYLEALARVGPFLERLKKPEVAFLRKEMSPHVEYALITFLERVAVQFKTDRQQVNVSEHLLRTHKGARDPAPLVDLENRLARVRGRDWRDLMPKLRESLAELVASPYIGKAAQAIGEFGKELKGVEAAFASLDLLYFSVRRERLRADIFLAVEEAQRKGLSYLRDCEFARARELYDTAYTRADDVAHEEPRKHFLDLLKEIERRGVRQEMKVAMDRIDTIVQTLEEVARRRDRGQADIAYRLLRDLVLGHVLVEFERKYRIPYLVVSTPAGAEVLVDNKLVGHTPCAIDLDIVKTAAIEVRRKGFRAETTELVPRNEKLDGTLDVALAKDLEWDFELEGAVEARPIVAGDRLLVATSKATLLAIDLADGERAWEASTDLLERIACAPVVAGDAVYLITVGGHVHRVRLRDGHIEYRFDLPGKVPHDAAFDGKTLYVAVRTRARPRLIAMRDTRVVWDEPLAYSPTTGILLKDGVLYMGTAEGEILAHDARTGKARTALKTPASSSIFGGLAEHGAMLLAGAEDGKLHALDPKTGRYLWGYGTEGPISARAVSDGTRIFLPARDGYVHEVDAKGGRVQKYDVGRAVETMPSLENGFLYAVGGNRIEAFDTVGKRPWWDHVFTKESPVHVVAARGFVVVITNRPWVHAFAKDAR